MNIRNQLLSFETRVNLIQANIKAMLSGQGPKSKTIVSQRIQLENNSTLATIVMHLSYKYGTENIIQLESAAFQNSFQSPQQT